MRMKTKQALQAVLLIGAVCFMPLSMYLSGKIYWQRTNRMASMPEKQHLHISNFKIGCDFTSAPLIRPEHDLMKLPPFKFHPDFKNPCWYEFSKTGNRSSLRCLPYFYVIGVKKSGTSDLYFRTMEHPELVYPPRKESQWFPRRRFQNNGTLADINVFIDMMSNFTVGKIEQVVRDSEGRPNYHPCITGDGTPANLHLNPHWKVLPGNEGLSEPRYVILDYIRHITPDVKIIVIFRNPIDRLYSDFFHEYGTLLRNNKPSQAQFHVVVEEGLRMFRDCLKVAPLRACVYEGCITRKTRIQIQLGLYIVFWRELLRVFPRDNILYLHTEEYAGDIRGSMNKVFSFLDVGALSDEKMTKIQNAEEQNKRSFKNKKLGQMWNTTRKMLFDFYKPFADEMVQFTGDKKFRLELT